MWELPPNGQGVAALLALNILDGLDVAGADRELRTHWQIEAIKLGFADAHAYVADPVGRRRCRWPGCSIPATRRPAGR